jgi:hypothetical protein
LNLLPLATWLTTAGATIFVDGQISQLSWANVIVQISFATTIAVNTLVTALIAFRILKVFLEVKPTSIERTLGTTEDTKIRHVLFVIIESGMALLAIQVLRFVLFNLPDSDAASKVYNLVIGVNVMLCVIIRSVHFVFFNFTDHISLARASHQQ